MINHELIKYQDNLYYVYRKFNSNKVKENKVHDLMRLLECDIVVKKTDAETILYFLRLIPELETY